MVYLTAAHYTTVSKDVLCVHILYNVIRVLISLIKSQVVTNISTEDPPCGRQKSVNWVPEHNRALIITRMIMADVTQQ